jgi:ubiquinone/menaquinone biosynthesis C-methylase UbiE
MINPTNTVNEHLAANAFSKQSAVFDEIYSPNKIIQYKRERVRAHVNQFLKAGSNILELNAGTGEDAIYFAKQGHNVHATDIAKGMLDKLSEKVKANGISDKISIDQCSFTALDTLKNKAPYDLIFSNFAGLNCTDQLSDVINSFKPLLSENGLVTMVLLPPFCLLELALVLRGNFKAAFRRFNSKNGAPAHIEGVHFTCWYYKPSQVVKMAKDDFDVLSIEGLSTIVPPSYFEHFADKRPKTFEYLKRTEDRFKSKWPWKNIGDYYIITLRKKSKKYEPA